MRCHACWRRWTVSASVSSRRTASCCGAAGRPPRLSEAPRAGCCVDTHVSGPPCCMYGLRVPASCVRHVREAQGNWCATVRTPYAYQPPGVPYVPRSVAPQVLLRAEHDLGHGRLRRRRLRQHQQRRVARLRRFRRRPPRLQPRPAAWLRLPGLTRTSRGLGTVRTGYAYQSPACCTHRRHMAAAAERYVHRTRISLGRAVRTA